MDIWEVSYYNVLGLFDLFIVYVIFSAAMETLAKKFVVSVTFLIDKYFEMKKKYLVDLASMPDAVDLVTGRKGEKLH